MTTFTQIDETTLAADHGITDEKGRAIGGIAYIGETGKWDRESETFIPDGGYCFRVQAARDGKDFGATTRSNKARCVTIEGAMEGARRALITQGNRYRESYEKTAAPAAAIA